MEYHINRIVREYSFGQIQKLKLIQCSIAKWQLALFDEITSGLDNNTILFLERKIEEWNNENNVGNLGHTVVCVGYYQNHNGKDWVIVLDNVKLPTDPNLLFAAQCKVSPLGWIIRRKKGAQHGTLSTSVSG